VTIRRLCLGTSTFAAGRQHPDKDSAPGIAAFADALRAGVRMVHSAPKYGTQPAARQAWEAAGCPTDVMHLIKVELAVDVSMAQTKTAISDVLESSARNLRADRLHALVVGVDLRRTADRARLVDYGALTAFYERCAETANACGLVDYTFGYAHSPGQLTAALATDAIAGAAAQYNSTEAWPAVFLDRIAASGRPFIAIAPLRRGRLVDHDATDAHSRLRALRWVLGHPAVTAAALTVSSRAHLAEALDAAQHPLTVQQVRDDLRYWLAAPVAHGNRPI